MQANIITNNIWNKLSALITADRLDYIIPLINEKKIDINDLLSNYGSLLHFAVTKKKQRAVTLLLRNNASTILYDAHGNSAIHIACKLGHIFILKLLFEMDEQHSLKDKINMLNNNLQSPIDIAFQNKNYPIVKYLIMNGAEKGCDKLQDNFLLKLFSDINMNNLFKVKNITVQNKIKVKLTEIKQSEEKDKFYNNHLRIVDHYEDTIKSKNLIINKFKEALIVSRVENERQIKELEESLDMRHLLVCKIRKKSFLEIKEKDEIIENLKKTSFPPHLKSNYFEMLLELKKSCQICEELYKEDEIMSIKPCGHILCLKCYSHVDICPWCRRKDIK